MPYESWLQYRKSSDSLSLHDDFHTYACEWTEEKVTFFMDGVETTSYEYKDTETAYLYEKPQYIVLSMLVGANYQNLTLDDERIQNRTRAVLNPLLDADYWTNGDNQFIIDYVQLFPEGRTCGDHKLIKSLAKNTSLFPLIREPEVPFKRHLRFVVL